MIKRGFAGCIIIFLLALVPTGLFCIEVDWVSGNVTYSHLKGEWQDLDVGMNLVSGDIIKTGLDSEATLRDEEIEMHILENTTFTISERYENEEKKSSFMLFLGRMKFKLAGRSKKEPEILTQTVSLTIRGTDFEVGSGYDGSTIVLITDGSVAVTGNTNELLLEKGEGTEVAFGEEPVEKFKVMTRVIEWDKWFDLSKEAIKGNELIFLGRIQERFKVIDAQIKSYERIRADSLKEKEEYLKKRDELVAEDKTDEAIEYSRKAGEKSKLAFHSIVNIRFLALSSIGLFDMAERIYSGIEKPVKEQTDAFESIKQTYKEIEKKYIWEGDRERLEQRAEKKKGCLRRY